MGTDSDDNISRQKRRVPMDRRAGLERRSDMERRLQNLDPPDGKERRYGMNRRSDLDRRSGIDRRLDIHDQFAGFHQGADEKKTVMESKGLFSCFVSLFKRWLG